MPGGAGGGIIEEVSIKQEIMIDESLLNSSMRRGFRQS